MRKIRCVLLDLGKVLLDFDFTCFRDRMRALTCLETEELRSAISGDGLAVRYESGLIQDGDFHKEICKRMGKELSLDEFTAAWNSIFLPTPIVREELLARLAEKAILWAVSNTNKLHFDFISSRYAFFRHFTGHSLSFEVGVLKPDPGIFHHALSGAEVQAAESLFIDDQEANVDAARKLGIDAFRFLRPEQFEEELRDRGLL